MNGGNHEVGRLEVICGSMFCGKTEELIRRVRRASIAKQRVSVFKPKIDNRYSDWEVVTHNGQKIKAKPIEFVEDIIEKLPEGTTVVALDEVQFFDPSIVSIIHRLIHRDIRVIAAGLDTDFRGEPFGEMPKLMCFAEEVTKLHAICVICGEDASRTQRLVNGKPALYDSPQILVGGQESYEARCRKHHEVPCL